MVRLAVTQAYIYANNIFNKEIHLLEKHPIQNVYENLNGFYLQVWCIKMTYICKYADNQSWGKMIISWEAGKFSHKLLHMIMYKKTKKKKKKPKKKKKKIPCNSTIFLRTASFPRKKLPKLPIFPHHADNPM